MKKSRVSNRFPRWTLCKKIILPWKLHGRVGVAQCRPRELAVRNGRQVLPAVAAIAAISATVTIAATSAISTASGISTATATTIATAAAIATTATAATTFTGSGFVDTNHAPHPFDVLKVVNGLLLGRIVG